MKAQKIDVFNGDADGLCALQQLRLAIPCEARLVTGPKRAVQLLEAVQAGPGDQVTVLDISLASNRSALEPLLDAGVEIEWFDHHDPGEAWATPPANLMLHIETGRDVCTSLIVDRHLGGRYGRWAVTGAFGDNLIAPALARARSLGLTPSETQTLQRLGESLNHNAYGDTEADLLVAPAALARALRPHDDPLTFADTALARELDQRRSEDLSRVGDLQPWQQGRTTAIYLLEDSAWARRVRGLLGNLLARQQPERALALASPTGRGSWTISIRTPPGAGRADAFCGEFEGGGGRAGAGGINDLPEAALTDFLKRFQRRFER